jgi:pimeloyl-ACP methyl ester carboxylesterase
MRPNLLRASARRTGFPAVLLLAAILVGLFTPWNFSDLTSHSNPAPDYAESVRRFSAWRAERAADMNPDCLAQLLTHGGPVQHVIVLVHGYTSCPAQFQQLGQLFYAAGYNVLIAPLPHHGLADRMTDEQSQLTAAELAAYADRAMDIADGLGARRTMLGISGGGVTTAWAAVNRPDLDLAVLIAPAFGFKQIPSSLTAAAMNAYSIRPNSYEWWDANLEGTGGPQHSYPRYSTHALTEILRLGFAVQADLSRAAPGAGRILIITNANDMSVNNERTAQIAALWKQAGANISTFEFPSSLKLPHDLIDPAQPDQDIQAVYPEIMSLVTQ